MEIAPHPQLLEALFVFRSKLSAVFRDIMGIHEINHIAVSQVSATQKILTFSSTPAMEFNLFNSNLWRYDNTYHPSWFQKCGQAKWESLYTSNRYDELYYLKQVKHHYPIGYTLAAKLEERFFIYSFASHRSCQYTAELFANKHEEFYKIGQYCSNMLGPLFQKFDEFTPQVDYETPN